MGFRETLPPDNCPPTEAHEGPRDVAFRLVPSATPTLQDFASHAALNEALPPGLDPCLWAACSFFSDMETIAKKRKLPRLRKYSHVAKLCIQAGSGRMLESKKHVSFWMYDTFDPLTAIVEVQDLNA